MKSAKEYFEDARKAAEKGLEWNGYKCKDVFEKLVHFRGAVNLYGKAIDKAQGNEDWLKDAEAWKKDDENRIGEIEKTLNLVEEYFNEARKASEKAQEWYDEKCKDVFEKLLHFRGAVALYGKAINTAQGNENWLKDAEAWKKKDTNEIVKIEKTLNLVEGYFNEARKAEEKGFKNITDKMLNLENAIELYSKAISMAQGKETWLADAREWKENDEKHLASCYGMKAEEFKAQGDKLLNRGKRLQAYEIYQESLKAYRKHANYFQEESILKGNKAVVEQEISRYDTANRMGIKAEELRHQGDELFSKGKKFEAYEIYQEALKAYTHHADYFQEESALKEHKKAVENNISQHKKLITIEKQKEEEDLKKAIELSKKEEQLKEKEMKLRKEEEARKAKELEEKKLTLEKMEREAKEHPMQYEKLMQYVNGNIFSKLSEVSAYAKKILKIQDDKIISMAFEEQSTWKVEYKSHIPALEDFCKERAKNGIKKEITMEELKDSIIGLRLKKTLNSTVNNVYEEALKESIDLDISGIELSGGDHVGDFS